MEVIPGLGCLTTVVWPTYLGVATDDPGLPGCNPLHEPYDDFDYSRGQIWWHTTPEGLVLGSAQVFAPKGVYTHFVFCHGPTRHMMCGKAKIEHPIVFDRAGIIDVEPIENCNYLPRMPSLPRLPA